MFAAAHHEPGLVVARGGKTENAPVLLVRARDVLEAPGRPELARRQQSAPEQIALTGREKRAS
jgi:hypothetical protein